MTDNPINLAMIGRLARRRWPVLVALIVIGGLLGFGASMLISPGYASSSKVLLQGDRSKDAVAGEVQIATSLVVLDRAATALNWGVSGWDLQSSVSASALDGNVVQIVGHGRTPEQARQLTDVATREYVKFSSQVVSDAAAAVTDAAQRSRDSMQQRLDESRKRAADLAASPALNVPGPEGDRTRSDLQQAEAAVNQTAAEIEAAEKRQQSIQLTDSLTTANLRVIEPAVPPLGPASPTMVELIVGGALLLLLLGILGHLIALRADRRVRSRSEIGAIVGAPVLGDVTMPVVRPTGRLAALHDDRRWALTRSPVLEDEHGRGVRHRRMLARIGAGDPPPRLLALLGQDDAHARAAVLDLALAASYDGRTVCLRTGDADLAEAARWAAETEPARGLTVAEPGATDAPAADLQLMVEVLARARPEVPDGPATEPTVLVTTVGTRTPFELNEMAGACVDAGRPLNGVLVVLPTHDDSRASAKTSDLGGFDLPDEPATSTMTVGTS